MKIILYNNTSKQNKIGKNLIKIKEIDGTLRDSVSIMSPSIQINHVGIPQANYCYIVEFNRYYFIEDITIDKLNLFTLTLKEDVLESFKDDILKQTCILERQEYLYNMYLKDNLMNVNSDTFTTYKSFPTSCFGGNEFVVITVG